MSKRSTSLYNQFYVDEGEGEPIVLLHGLFGQLSSWTSVVNHFSKSHRVIMPRLPLFEIPQQYVNLERLSIILDEFLDWHQLADVTLVGNSMGGQLALLYALRKPENISKLILTGSAGLFDHASGKTSRAAENKLVREKVSHPFYNKNKTSNEWTEEYDARQSTTEPFHLPEQVRHTQNNLVESLHRIKQPTLLVWGLQDEITPPEVALHFHDLLPNSEVKFIDHCGHAVMNEHPDLFNQYVEKFLNT